MNRVSNLTYFGKNSIHFLRQRRNASYSVDVYLIKDHATLGKAGSVIEVKPGYARNVLLPQKYAILMGEGEFRKQVPILYEKKLSKDSKITKKVIIDEKERFLSLQVPMAEDWLQKLTAIDNVAGSDLSL